jgi:hypothetical protein
MNGRLGSSAAVLLALAVCATARAEQAPPVSNAAMPALPRAGATVESLVPSGWSIEQRHDADFNGDGRADALLLLRQGGTAAATMPARLLLVAIATARPAGYERVAANSELVPHDPSGRLEDPMADGEIIVRRGGFDLKIGMMPTGSYLAATMRYRFRLDGRCVRLIGFDRNETHRATLDTHDVSVNFLSGDVIEKTGNAQSGQEQTSRKQLARNPRRCLPELPSGWTFDPLAASPP